MMPASQHSPRTDLVRQHMIFGWCTLLLFLSLGLLLEALHGLKLGWYLGNDAQTRRLMWTLAHTHGSLLGLLNIAFAATVSIMLVNIQANLKLASLCLMGASILMPAGFFLGGAFIYATDPGLGVFLVPPGGLLLFIAVASVAARLWQLPQ
jgi:hypothetical protein